MQDFDFVEIILVISHTDTNNYQKNIGTFGEVGPICYRRYPIAHIQPEKGGGW